MKLVNFSLKVGLRKLIDNANTDFSDGKVNHLLGKNGVGKTCLAKALFGVLPYKGRIVNKPARVTLIGSCSGIPIDLKVRDVVKLASKNAGLDLFDTLYNRLEIDEISKKNTLKRISDGQRQKLKLLYFLSVTPQLLILDEFTNALDKKSSFQLYDFFNWCVAHWNITIINITHNLSDVEYIAGNCFLLADKSIVSNLSKTEAVEMYVKG